MNYLEKNYRYVIEITLVVDDVGTQQTFYYSTDGFSTKPTDTPSNTFISGRLRNPGFIQRSLFSGSFLLGAVKPSWGEIILNNGDGQLDAWMNYGVSGGKVIVRRGTTDSAYPSGYTTVYIAYSQHIVADFTEIRVRIRDRLIELDKPVVPESFAGTGGLEGDDGIASKKKQLVSGSPSYIPPILMSASDQIYFVQQNGTGGLSSSFKVYEGGIEITRSTDYADSASLLSSAPSPGQVKFWFGNSGDTGPVYFRLGSVPIYELRVLAVGYAPTGAAWQSSNIIARAGISATVISAGGIGAQFGEVLIDDDRTYLESMSDVAQAAAGFFGFTRLDEFIHGSLTSPSTTALKTFTEHNAYNYRREPIDGMDAPIYSLNFSNGKTYPATTATGASATQKDYWSRNPWWYTSSYTDSSIKTANPGAITYEMQVQARYATSSFGFNSMRTNFMNLFGVRRQFYMFNCPITDENLDLELHDTIELKLPRFGLSSGKKFRIINQRIDCSTNTITYGVWG